MPRPRRSLNASLRADNSPMRPPRPVGATPPSPASPISQPPSPESAPRSDSTRTPEMLRAERVARAKLNNSQGFRTTAVEAARQKLDDDTEVRTIPAPSAATIYNSLVELKEVAAVPPNMTKIYKNLVEADVAAAPVDNVDAIPASPIVATPDSTQRFASYALATPKLRRPSDAEVDGALKRMSYSDKVDAFRTAAYMAGIYLSSSETESALSEAGGDVTAALAATMDRSGVLREDRLSPGLSPASNGSSPHALRSPARSRSVERLKDMLKERRTPSVSTTSVGSSAGMETATESVRGSPHTSPRTSHSTSPDEPHRLLESPSPLSSANDRSPNSIVLAPVALQPHASAKRHTSVPPTQLRLASAELLAASTQQPEGALDTTLDLDAEQEAEQEAAQAWADKMERRMQLAAVLLIVRGGASNSAHDRPYC